MIFRADNPTEEQEQTLIETLTLSDEVRRLPSIKVGIKIKSVDLVTGTDGELRIAISLANNSLELHSVKQNDKETQGDFFST